MTPDEEREKMIKGMRFDEGREQDLNPDEARKRMLRRMRLDADGDEGEEETREGGESGGSEKPHYGNTRLPYGLCKRFGIDLAEGATPREAWAALEKGTGYTHDQVMGIVERTGSTKEVGKGAKPEGTGKETAGKGMNGAAGKTASENVGNGRIKRKPLTPIEVPKYMSTEQCDEWCKKRFGPKSDLITDSGEVTMYPKTEKGVLGALGAVEEKFGVSVDGVVAKDNVEYDKNDMPQDHRSHDGVYIDDGMFYIDSPSVNIGKKSSYDKGIYANFYKGELDKAEKKLTEAKELYEKYKDDWNAYGKKYHPGMEATHSGGNSFEYYQMVQSLVPDAERERERADRDYARFKDTPQFVGDPERPEETCVYKAVGKAIAYSLGDCAKYFKGRDLAEVSIRAYRQTEDINRSAGNWSKIATKEANERAAQTAFEECFTGCMLGMDMPKWCYDMVDDAGKRLQELKKEREKKRQEHPDKPAWHYPDPTKLESSKRLWIDTSYYQDDD